MSKDVKSIAEGISNINKKHRDIKRLFLIYSLENC